MNAFVRNAANIENALARTPSHLNSSYTYGKAPAYRRLTSQLAQRQRDGVRISHNTLPSAISTPLRSPFLPSELRLGPTAVQSRLFHVSPCKQEDKKPKSEAPKPEEPKTDETEQKSEAEQAKKSEEGEGKEEGKEERKAEGEGEGEGKDGGKKEDLPPPPPHGDKTPWQVFMETMNTEFQASKEWNESTKQIGAAAHQFSESESVRRAREAYEKSTGAVSSSVSTGVKTTASAIGKGAAWTWDTSAMKGVRKAANATGDALDKATKPIRDTDAYKNVKNVIDDGSSSRYGGWVEKEERRKKRELREQQSGEAGKVFQEDPEYVY